MNKIFKRIVISVSALALTAGLAACGGDKANVDNADSNKLTYWVELNANASQTVSNLAETPFAKKLMEEAVTAAEAKGKEMLVEAKEDILKAKTEAERENKERRAEIQRQEKRLQKKYRIQQS